jgi:hypothetical protein
MSLVDLRPSARNFQYTALSRATHEIRLLQLASNPHPSQEVFPVQCTIHQFPLDSTPPYQALSYTWGKEADYPPFMLLEGCEFSIRPNLHSALYQIRSSHSAPEYLWIDAICINQDDTEEKNSQVSLMKEIFRYAKRVIVWLGPANILSGDAFALLHLLEVSQSSAQQVEEIIQDPDRAEEWRALIDLFQRAYWRRAWVIQEVQVAKRITVLCGDDEIEWDNLLRIQRMLWDEHAASLFVLAQSRTWLQNLHYWIRGRGARGLDHLPQSPQGDLFRTLLFHRLKEATDPRDKVYSLLGLTSASDEIEVNYRRDVKKVYIDTATYVIRTSGKLDVLWAVPPHRDRFSLPSWVPDWSIDEDLQAEMAWGLQEPKLEYIYHASGTTVAEATVSSEEGILTAKGVVVTTIAQLGGATQMTHSRDIQQAIVAVHEWYSLVEEHQDDGNALLENFARTLRCDRVKFEDGDRHGTISEKLLAIMATIKELKSAAQIKALKESMKREDIQIRAEIEGIAQQTFKRRFFLSSSGTMGLAHEEALAGDLICVLLGCSVPVVLRAIDSHYIHVSDVYLDGYMSGRAVGEADDGKLDFRDFEIC